MLALAGLHSGCQEVWVAPGITGMRDLRGKRIAVFKKDTGDQFFNFFATALAYYGGFDPFKDVEFFEIESTTGNTSAYGNLLNNFVAGRSDAFLAAADGAALLRRNPRPSSTKILDQAGKEVLRVTDDGHSFAPIWSPAGNAVAFLHLEGTIVDLRMATPDLVKNGHRP